MIEIKSSATSIVKFTQTERVKWNDSSQILIRYREQRSLSC